MQYAILHFITIILEFSNSPLFWMPPMPYDYYQHVMNHSLILLLVLVLVFVIVFVFSLVFVLVFLFMLVFLLVLFANFTCQDIIEYYCIFKQQFFNNSWRRKSWIVTTSSLLRRNSSSIYGNVHLCVLVYIVGLRAKLLYASIWPCEV